VSDEIQAFGWREQLERDRDEFDDLVEAPRSRRPQKRFQLRNRHLDRIEVGAVRREKAKASADPFNGSLNFGLFVRREVIEDHDIARPQHWDQHLLDVREKRGAIDGAVEDRWRRQAVDP